MGINLQHKQIQDHQLSQQREGNHEKVQSESHEEHLEIYPETYSNEYPEIVTEEPEHDQNVHNLVRKLDIRMMPFLFILFLFAFLDRVNIGHARLYGLEKDLNLTPNQYGWGLSIFFVGYVLFEIPSNLMMQRISPPKWIARIMITWGIVTISSAWITNISGLLASRFFLGVFEAGMFPGIVYYLGLWYTREEQALRISIFFSASLVAGAFGGLLSYAISGLNGVGGLHPWQWIYIIEGIPTILLGVMSWFVLPSTPFEATWLKEKERSLLLKRLESNHVKVGGSKFDPQQLKQTLKDPKTYLYVLAFFGCCSPLYAMALLLPTIINGLGFPPLHSLLLSVPPYLLSLVISLLVAKVSDKIMDRSLPTIICSLIGAISFGTLLGVHSPWYQYSLLALAISTTASCFPTILSWSNNNSPGGTTKSATTSALIIMAGNFGGFLSGQLYKPIDGPNFLTSHTICMSWLLITFVSTIILRWSLISCNKKLERKSAVDSDDNSSSSSFRYII